MRLKQLSVSSEPQLLCTQDEAYDHPWARRVSICVQSACFFQTWHSLLSEHRGCDPSLCQHNLLDGNGCHADVQWYCQVLLSTKWTEESHCKWSNWLSRPMPFSQLPFFLLVINISLFVITSPKATVSYLSTKFLHPKILRFWVPSVLCRSCRLFGSPAPKHQI